MEQQFYRFIIIPEYINVNRSEQQQNSWKEEVKERKNQLKMAYHMHFMMDGAEYDVRILWSFSFFYCHVGQLFDFIGSIQGYYIQNSKYFTCNYMQSLYLIKQNKAMLIAE